MYEVIIVGGGPAGLSAALLLGRSCRRVLVCDSGHPRNAAARTMHGFLTRDGIAPAELLQLGRDELACYDVEFRQAEVVAARRRGEADAGGHELAFVVTLDNGEHLFCRKLLLTTGLRDELPAIEGLQPLYGASVHHCPYCDAWEHRGQRLAAYGQGPAASGLALSLRTWSEHVTACTDGEPLDPEYQQHLRRNGIDWRQERVVRAVGEAGQLKRIEFDQGPPLECDALFFNTNTVQQSELAAMLGCKTRDELVHTHGKQRTGVPGVFLAGDADGDVQFAIVAAAEGARAAVAINHELQDEDRG